MSAAYRLRTVDRRGETSQVVGSPVQKHRGIPLFAEGLRTNVLHLPVVGFGDGGVFTTVEDVHMLWSALIEGRLGDDALRTMTTPPVPDARYGMGMWLDKQPGTTTMEGMDAGVSFRSTRSPDGSTYSVLSNTSDRAWPMAQHLAEMLGDKT